MMKGIDHLIINNPYEEPTEHWRYDRATKEFERISGRRPAGFLTSTKGSTSLDDPGIFHELSLANKIRRLVKEWRARGYPGTTGMTKQLLRFWRGEERLESRLFFCQLEAAETLIWLVEAPEDERRKVEIPQDCTNRTGGLHPADCAECKNRFQRMCCKMATGTGKTVVMAMVIAWQAINKATYPDDPRFSRDILVVAPGLTVRSRLQVLYSDGLDNFYDQFELVPSPMHEKLRRCRIRIHNWHKLEPETDPPTSVVKRGPESPAVFTRRILGHDGRDILVINDEAHHAYRVESRAKGVSQADSERDKLWMEGLDMIHEERGILHCFDFSATPFTPSSNTITEEAIFDWVVSDFSLNDAIESGLTKTPRVVIRDNSGTYDEEYRSKFYHVYADPEVKADLNQKASRERRLHDLVRNAYMLLGNDWYETRKAWKETGHGIPPVMITVCNSTHTAERIVHSFQAKRFGTGDLYDEKHMLHIDSKTIKKAESGTGGSEEATLRDIVNTVGKPGKPGEQIRNIVAVDMLSEGWDARNVTQIMGLRAFSSQLLCEQVVGRGLRRTSYELQPDTGLFSPEYVNIFGIPFTFLPHEGGNGPPPPPASTTLIEPDPQKIRHEISWPNVDRIETEYTPVLSIGWDVVSPLKIKSTGVSTTAGMDLIIDAKPVNKMSGIDLNSANESYRLQRIVFLAARDVYNDIRPNWRGQKEFLLLQAVRLVEEFIDRGLVQVTDVVNDTLRERITILFNMGRVTAHVLKNITRSSTSGRKLHLNPDVPVKSTSMMRPWHTRRPCEHTKKSHINMAVYDKSWEVSTGHLLETHKNVTSWAKNDHLGFVVKYFYEGTVHDYIPDFIIRFDNGINLILEVKGKESDRDKEKRKALQEWIDVVNENGTFGTWSCDIAYDPSDVEVILARHATSKTSARTFARCPSCHKEAFTRWEVDDRFGFRNMTGVIRPQSWCRGCRKKY